MDFDAYARLIVGYTHPDGQQIRGRHTQATLLAIGAAESALDNHAVGVNSKNGTPPSSPAYNSVGLGWLQHDSYWLAADADANGLEWSIEEILGGPAFSLWLLFARPGFVLFQGVDQTYVDFSKWATWPRLHDPHLADAAAAINRAHQP